MTKRTAKIAVPRNLSANELSSVVGGQNVYSKEFPTAGKRSFEPGFGPPPSIAAGEVNANSTDDNLPD